MYNHSITTNFADNMTFANHLASVFCDKNNRLEGLQVISREPAAQEGTFQAEIVTCSFCNSPTIKVRCKYLKGHENNQEGGHRGGVEYEAKIHRELLEKLPLPLAHFYGQLRIVQDNTSCLVLEYLEGSVRITQSTDPDTTLKAAKWIGSLHSFYEKKDFPAIKKYDEEYYKQWNRNVENIGRELKDDQYWIQQVCTYYDRKIFQLLTSPQTLIHGEYYPNNILYKDGAIYPVDWESAAFAAGEIDLASLTEGWGEDLSARMINTYIEARWQNLEQKKYDEFLQRLNIARLYLQLRWMGRNPDLETWKKKPGKFKNFNKRLEKLFTLSKSIQIF